MRGEGRGCGGSGREREAAGGRHPDFVRGYSGWTPLESGVKTGEEGQVVSDAQRFFQLSWGIANVATGFCVSRVKKQLNPFALH